MLNYLCSIACMYRVYFNFIYRGTCIKDGQVVTNKGSQDNILVCNPGRIIMVQRLFP